MRRAVAGRARQAQSIASYKEKKGSVMKAVTISARILLMIAVSVGALLIVGVVGLYVASTGTQIS